MCKHFAGFLSTVSRPPYGSCRMQKPIFLRLFFQIVRAIGDVDLTKREAYFELMGNAQYLLSFIQCRSQLPAGLRNLASRSVCFRHKGFR